MSFPVSEDSLICTYLHPLLFLCYCVKLVVILQVHIVQRGAVRPLIEMLQSPDVQLREMSAFALGRLAQVSTSLSLFFFTFFRFLMASFYAKVTTHSL